MSLWRINLIIWCVAAVAHLTITNSAICLIIPIELIAAFFLIVAYFSTRQVEHSRNRWLMLATLVGVAVASGWLFLETLSIARGLAIAAVCSSSTRGIALGIQRYTEYCGYPPTSLLDLAFEGECVPDQFCCPLDPDVWNERENLIAYSSFDHYPLPESAPSSAEFILVLERGAWNPLPNSSILFPRYGRNVIFGDLSTAQLDPDQLRQARARDAAVRSLFVDPTAQ